ncbi:hypothetical protein [Pectobacterium carotovorum]|uniref:hypothetical protein n=1 Tax=Pectobacterium carotovorum TaxID=554 RepID=UPI00207F7444|nr:hypothetical protein [Pectobacterium carotovorum]GKV89326.1 hypothetical protein PEC301619_13080 [Pectobacterium carotovorum subsp. carotovorum]
MSKETGGPAFPVETQLNPISNQACKHQTADGHIYQFPGMTLRDYFAAKAMQGWLSSYGVDAVHPAHSGNAVDAAKNAYALADAMLKARIS